MAPAQVLSAFAQFAFELLKGITEAGHALRIDHGRGQLPVFQAGLQQRGREVFAAEKVVAGGGVHFDQRQSVFQHRDVEGAAAQIEDQRAFEFLLVQPVSHGSGGRFVDQACHREPGQFGGEQRAFALFVAEVRRHGNHCFRNRVAEKGFGVLLE